jgi:hypothetical protein
MNKTAALLIAASLLLASCASVTKVEGEQVLNGRMAIKVDDAWNKVSIPGNKQPYETWTQEGLSLDQLRFWAGIKPGQPLMSLPPNATAAGQKAPRVPTFTNGMAPDQLVAMFETMYSVDGSVVRVTKVEPSSFAGGPGLRFEFTIARKRDDLQLRGAGWAAVRNDELFAATFVAPELAFYPRLAPKALKVVATAQIK